VSIDRDRIERICAARFPMWATMGEKTKDQYRRQAEFWTEAVDQADADTADQ
jgi:hypothetical protein